MHFINLIKKISNMLQKAFIVVNTYGLNHSLAGKYNVTHSPTILFKTHWWT
jgi:hypothetical protein